MSPHEQSQLGMLHRLPSAPLVERIPWLCELAAGKRVVHIGFADAGYVEMQQRHGSWLHEHLARVSSDLVGLDVDPAGVERARGQGYEAHVVDCRRPDQVRSLALEPADVVIAGEVIEHLDDPGTLLDGLHELCAPGGILVLTTPNSNGLLNTVAALGDYEINHPDHVVMFTWRTLTTLLRRHGWEPVETRTFVPALKEAGADEPKTGALRLGGQLVLWLERVLARAGRPFVADGLIVVSRPSRRD